MPASHSDILKAPVCHWLNPMALLKSLPKTHVEALRVDTVIKKLENNFSSIASYDTIPMQVRYYAKNCLAFVRSSGSFMPGMGC